MAIQNIFVVGAGLMGSGIAQNAITSGYTVTINDQRQEALDRAKAGIEKALNRDVEKGRVFITSQNHGYMVLADSVDPAVAEVSHINVNDGTCEGLRYQRPNCFTTQFHPEANAGPKDTEYLFNRFIDNMAAKKGGAQ